MTGWWTRLDYARLKPSSTGSSSTDMVNEDGACQGWRWRELRSRERAKLRLQEDAVVRVAGGIPRRRKLQEEGTRD